MKIQIKKAITNYWNKWIKKRSPIQNPQIFTSNNIYILPSGFGIVFGLLVICLLIGAINYQVSTVFLMTFLLGAVGLISAWEAHANLKEISIKLLSIEDVQQGKPAQVLLLIQGNDKIRYSLEFQIKGYEKQRVEKIPLEGTQFILPLETTTRGFFSLPRIVLSSLFPFGIFRVWGYAFFDKGYYVYPEPVSPNYWPPLSSFLNKKKEDFHGDNEFYEVKQVENPWVQPNLIAWKLAAKGQGWYQKIMDTQEGEYYFFKLNDSQATHLEEKLQHLSYWIQNAELMGLRYGLELGSNKSPISNGPIHLRDCLRQLAVYQ